MLNYDVAVIGSGPGGYVAAIRAAQRGFKTVLIEKDRIGGVCLNWGCIPTKAIIHSAAALGLLREASELGIGTGEFSADLPQIIARSRKIADQLGKGVAFQLKKNKVDILEGHAKLLGGKRIRVSKPGGDTEEIEAKAIILASGSRPKELPHIPIDGKRVIGSRHALELAQLPTSIAVIGAGAIGVEFAWIYRQLGVEVLLIEALDSLLPNEDAEISAELLRQFKKQKIRCYLKSKVIEVRREADALLLQLENPGGREELRVETLLSAVGVRANIEDIGLEEAGIELENGFIRVDANQRTGAEGIYAVGDVAGNPCLAHKASKEGLIAVDHISGKKVRPLDKNAIPACTYCEPQVASAGLRERDAEQQGIDYGIAKVNYRSIGKAIAVGRFDGFLKCIYEKKSGRLLGAHCIGAEATELIAELTLALSRGLSMEEIADVIHAHPTLSELILESAEQALGEGIHA
ncbi:MAG: dihydrolipoyl dehydrogenase [Candidatus Neomarinimicrobiota bacterium]|jgi:dihydrolipoamide dehydrogenase|nr:dihydrolipoyl dehydrogenase [Candidatus Neomarinimicrobiota bacterium]MDX9779714.1 dihydrolipoyl dehydrogenase [bacterium]